MAEHIYVRNESGYLEPLTETRFEREDTLQALLAQHPELLDGEQIRPGNPLRWILITREQGIAVTGDAAKRWSLDVLVIDQDATPTLVEVKLGSNSEVRRKVVGQMLDYAAHAHTIDATELRRTFEAKGQVDDLQNLIEYKYEDARAFWEQVARNLREKRLRLLFVADAIPDELARIVEFLNEKMSDDVEVLAVEVKQFPGGTESRIFVPRVIGRLAKSRSGSGAETKRLYRDFWEGFLLNFEEVYNKDKDTEWSIHKFSTNDLTNRWLTFDAGRPGMHYSFDFANDSKTQVNFWLESGNDEAERIFAELRLRKDDVERHFSDTDNPVEWDRSKQPAGWGIHIRYPEQVSIGDRERWPEVRAWAIERLGALRAAIQPHLDNL